MLMHIRIFWIALYLGVASLLCSGPLAGAALLSTHHYYVVNLTQTVDAIDTGLYLVLYNKSIHRIEDDRSLPALGYDNGARVAQATSFPRHLVQKQPLPLLMLKGNTPNDIIQLHLLKSKVLVGNLLWEMEFLGKFFNPSLIHYHGGLLLATRKWIGGDFLHVQWLNSSLHNRKIINGTYLGIGTRLQPLLPTKPGDGGGLIKGEDPRMIHHKNKIWMTFTYNRMLVTTSGMTVIQTGLVEFSFNTTSKKIELTKLHRYLDYDTNKENQKNWMPFIFRDEVHYVTNMNPMQVVRILEDGEFVEVNLMSFSPRVQTHWQYGELRGGTNAISVDKDRYLAFFHSSVKLPGREMLTYFMGAFTFSASTPFRLLEISPLPIMDERLYTGQWVTPDYTDYVIFPTSLIRDKYKKDLLLLSFGHQNKDGYLAKISLRTLLKTLVPASK